MLTINFHHNRKKKLNRDGRAVITMRLYMLEKNVYHSTGIYIFPNEWDNKKQRVKVNRFALEYNQELLEWREKALEAYFDLKRDNQVTLERIILKLKGADDSGDFIKFVQKEVDRNKEIEKSTIGQHHLLIKYLKRHNTSLPYTKLTYQYLVSFQSFLRSQTSERKKPLHQNYIALLFRIFRGYVTEAIKQGLLNIDPFLSFKIKTIATKKVFLYPEEIEAFKNVELKSKYPNEAHVKQMFIFACYTGLRISDVQGLKGEHIRETPEGLRVNKKPKKTAKNEREVDLALRLLFEGQPEEILKPYYEGKGADDLIFPEMILTTYNYWVKKLRTRAGIEKHFTSHTARHTFGMEMIKRVRIEAVQKLMGHADLSTTQVYARLSTASVDDSLKNPLLKKNG